MGRSQLASHIRTLREDFFKETQAQFAARLNLSRVAVSRYEVGRVPKREILELLRKLAVEKEYVPAQFAFVRALGGRWRAGKTQLVPLEPDADQALFELAVQAYADWSNLKSRIDIRESAKCFAEGLESNLKLLMNELSKMSVMGDGR
jgi:transcriptional regulator with XRE-family HTH domain